MNIDRTIEQWRRNLERDLQQFSRQIDPSSPAAQRAMDNAAQQLADAIRQAAPEANQTLRYKFKNGKYAEYQPGNLKRSIRVFTHMKDKRNKYVGPYVVPRAMDKTGAFSGDRADGWYAHIVEARRPFIRPAVMQNEGRILAMLRNELQRIINAAAR